VYTLVQHSGYGVAGKPGFARAVEEAAVEGDKLEERIRAAGGILFDAYGEASEYATEFNYPPEAAGLVPRAQGTFHSKVKVGGLRLYIPSERDLAVVSVKEVMES